MSSIIQHSNSYFYSYLNQNKMLEEGLSTFYSSEIEEPHKQRCKDILEKHPDVVKLIGRNPYTAVLLVMIVALQIGIAAYLGSLGTSYWWLSAIMAFGIGAFANHCLYVIIHEATHNLIFKKRILNIISGLVADIPNAFPGALAFRSYHLKHHAHMGDHGFDGDLPNQWEAKLVGNSWWRKVLWMGCYPVIQASRSIWTNKVATFNRWVVLNLILIVILDALWVYLFGWNALIYLFFSLFFALGLHPLGARWIQEHFTLTPEQETYSYYGPLNVLALNVGYHNEHHDFSSIPWNKLPELRKLAPEFYDTLIYHTSWTKLLLSFLFNPSYSLYSRITRLDPSNT